MKRLDHGKQKYFKDGKSQYSRTKFISLILGGMIKKFNNKYVGKFGRPYGRTPCSLFEAPRDRND